MTKYDFQTISENQLRSGNRAHVETVHRVLSGFDSHLTKEREGWMLLMMGSWL